MPLVAQHGGATNCHVGPGVSRQGRRGLGQGIVNSRPVA